MNIRTIAVAAFAVAIVGCGGGGSPGGGNGDGNQDADTGVGGSDAAEEEYAAEVPEFGEESSAVLVVNPEINEGSATSVEIGSERSVPFELADRNSLQTDETGLASLTGLPTDQLDLEFETGTTSFEVQNEGEHYDLVAAVRDDGAEYVVQPIRYPIGGTVKRLEDGDSLEEAVSEDDVVVFLGPGTYSGDFQIKSENVLIFGAWDPEEGPQAVVDGNLEVRGGGNRLRSVEVTGTISSPANGFAAAFCTFEDADITGNNVTLIRNDFTGGDATVPSSSAVLVDNDGIP